MSTGTNYFVSFEAAKKYYRMNGKAIRRKVEAGEIAIGKPPAKEGFKIWIHPTEQRYFYYER